jgi:hypothetical protein
LVCLERIPEALQVQQQAYQLAGNNDQQQDREVLFNLCVILLKSGAPAEACSRWLVQRGISLESSANELQALLDKSIVRYICGIIACDAPSH